MAQEYYQQGLAKAKAGDYQGAIADFDLALISTPEWAEVYYRRGLAYFDLGDTLTAVSDYTQALAIDSQHRDCSYARALARLTLKNFPGALVDIERAILFGRDYAPAYQLKGLVCKKLTKYPDAIAAYKVAANLYLAQKDVENSQRCLDLARTLEPKPIDAPIAPKLTPRHPLTSPEQFYAQLLEQGERGDLPGALDHANWAIQSSPNEAWVYACRGALYSKQDNRTAALTDFNRAIQLDPNAYVAYRGRGKLRDRMGDYRGALMDFDRAVAINAQDLFIYLARGNVRVNLHDYPGAIADFDRAISIDPVEPLAYLKRAQIYIKLEELNHAIEDYQTAANIYLERQDLAKYQDTLASLQKLQRSAPQSAPPPNQERSQPPQNAALRQRLYVLVSGQWAIAQRLIDRLKEEYPGYDEDWYLERVIDNLEAGL
ncbi:tetratricopeptide repeat protein [Chamaesiphon sp. OTE_75_metabat_556]|uniref:tetratricopeptide repeat protein n=1 Tax=Chamaesiphon sp. OTE_75_metabat_556 TaxID=2964692 RepID=UPI00286C105E|nr:tetratricopeptide repeat protein [Chamaesiphon sp. OTE_75_metabat_556]